MAIFAQDTLAGTAGNKIETRAAADGSTWLNVQGNKVLGAIFRPDGLAAYNADVNCFYIVNNAGHLPTGYRQTVQADFTVKTLIASTKFGLLSQWTPLTTGGSYNEFFGGWDTASPGASGWTIYTSVASGSPVILATVATPTPVAGHTYTIRLETSEYSQRLYVSDNGGAFALIVQVNSNTLATSAVGACGFYLYTNASASTNTTGYHIANFFAMSTPQIAITSRLPTAINLTGPAGFGGSGVYTPSWIRDTDPAFPAAVTVGTASTTLSDTTAVPGTTYFYRYRVTDSNGLVVQFPIMQPIIVPSERLQVVGMGDSIMHGTNLTTPATQNPLINMVQILGTQAKVSVAPYVDATNNKAVAGSFSTQWTPGNGAGYYTAAKTAWDGLSIPPTDIVIMLGTNDANSANGPVSTATYQSNMQSIVNQLHTDYPTARIWLFDPIFYYNSQDAFDLYNSRLFNYGAALTTVAVTLNTAAGSTICYHPTTNDFAYFGMFTNEFIDTIHPTAQGALDLANLWTTAQYDTLYPSGGGGGGTGSGNLRLFIGI